jgi:hypothetical protein
MTLLILTLIFSILLNGFFIWYGIKMLSKLLYTADNLGDLYAVFRVYEKFCDSLYEMDMFYGEPTIEELIRKTKVVRAEIERFEEIYSLTSDMDSLEEELANDTYEEETRQEA